MLEKITKWQSLSNDEKLFSILIPTWNNLEYLKLCIKSIRTHSSFQHQIIVIINAGIDGTLDWVKQESLDYVYAKENIGICYGLNAGRSLVSTDYVLYVNDDMYMLPEWDLFLKEEIHLIGHNEFMLSSTMIEPHETGNSCVAVADFGDSLETFREEQLLKEFNSIAKEDWNGSTWPPNIVHKDMWDLVGGMSIEFSPGMYSDPDLSAKLWKTGVRYFKGVGSSKVYHFGSKSTKRLKTNIGSNLFLSKWGITANTFSSQILKRNEKHKGKLNEAHLSGQYLLKNFVKKLIKSLSLPKF